MLKPAVKSFVESVEKNVEEIEAILEKTLDLAIIEETLKQYSSILNTLNIYEANLQQLANNIPEGAVKNAYRTKKEVYDTLLQLNAVKVNLLNLLLKLRKKKNDLESGVTINLNFTSQKNELDYIEVSLEET